MDLLSALVGLINDPRAAIAAWIVALGPVLVYTPLFLIVFVETGLVFFPFLPGDSLLFAAGVFSAEGGGLNLAATLAVFISAAILGNTSKNRSSLATRSGVKALTLPESMMRAPKKRAIQ